MVRTQKLIMRDKHWLVVGILPLISDNICFGMVVEHEFVRMLISKQSGDPSIDDQIISLGKSGSPLVIPWCCFIIDDIDPVFLVVPQVEINFL